MQDMSLVADCTGGHACAPYNGLKAPFNVPSKVFLKTSRDGDKWLYISPHLNANILTKK